MAKKGEGKNVKMSCQRAPGVTSGTQKGSFLRRGGPRGVALGTPGATLATQGVTLEPQGPKKWIDLMIAKRSGTILELPGGIWVAIWGHFGDI